MLVKRAVVLMFASVIASTLLGCGGGPVAKPVDPVLAEQTLTKVLDEWKSGNLIEQCQQLQPSVVVQEFYWMQGEKLEDYKIISSEVRDANLYVTTELRLKNTEGRSHTEEVTYCVGTDPVLTVFRMMM